MPCDCLDKVNKELEQFNTEVSTAFSITQDLSKMDVVILVATNKKDSKKRGSPRSLSAAYCPFCGKKW